MQMNDVKNVNLPNEETSFNKIANSELSDNESTTASIQANLETAP